MIGKVKWFDSVKGFGFLVGDGNEEFFVHCTHVSEGLELEPELEVEFDVVSTDKGVQAQNVRGV